MVKGCWRSCDVFSSNSKVGNSQVFQPWPHCTKLPFHYLDCALMPSMFLCSYNPVVGTVM